MRMTVASWNMMKHFKPGETTQPMLMDQDLMFKLDAMRGWVGKPFIVHASYATDGHSTDSMHYQGKAVDGHFVGLSLWIQLNLLANARLSGPESLGEQFIDDDNCQTALLIFITECSPGY